MFKSVNFQIFLFIFVKFHLSINYLLRSVSNYYNFSLLLHSFNGHRMSNRDFTVLSEFWVTILLYTVVCKLYFSNECEQIALKPFQSTLWTSSHLVILCTGPNASWKDCITSAPDKGLLETSEGVEQIITDSIPALPRRMLKTFLSAYSPSSKRKLYMPGVSKV